jgi:superfamily II DNA or RNA helicase
MTPISISISRKIVDEAAALARHCSSAVTRERVLVSQTVALSARQYFREHGIDTKDGRSASPKYVELLDVCDFYANNWSIEVRAVTRVEHLGLYVPTVPLMVGLLSDFYVCAQVDTSLREANVFGYVTQERLADADLSQNGLFAILPLEDLTPMEGLWSAISLPKASDPEIRRSFEEWQQRASRIVGGLADLLSAEGVFNTEQVERLALGLRDDVVRIWGERLPATGLEPLFDRLFGRFGIAKPVPAPPGEPTLFLNPTEEQARVSGSDTQAAFFRDNLGVNERVSLYRHLLEQETALNEHRQMKRALDRVTKGKHQTSPRRRARIRAERERKAESSLLDANDTSGEGQYNDQPSSLPPPSAHDPRVFVAAPAAYRDFMSSGFAAETKMTYGQIIDFSADPEVVRLVVEAERLSYGHLVNPAFATEISLIDPLPHQRIAVYEHMLKQTRLRFLLADDAGAGKTIMTGLYIREMLTRRLINRVLIVPPAGLVGNWEREMHKLFSLPFNVITGSDAKNDNPFVGPESNLLIVSVDTLAGDRMFSRLQHSDVAPYDLVIFDEAHKLSADREPDLSMRKTDRYRLAEAIAGISSEDDRWKLDWNSHHLLLLTATPHMGKDFPYYCLWRLLEPDVLSTYTAFSAYPKEARARHFIRKEEMVRYDGTPIYPTRVSDTLSYDLTQGEISEQPLYDQTTSYIQNYYNRARILNRSAARLAMTVFQRRLASSTYALLRSFERRLQKLNGYIEGIRSGRISMEALQSRQRKLDDIHDVLDEKTADEETVDADGEENEKVEDQALGGVVAVSLGELEAERIEVQGLLDLARKVYDAHAESKFERLREVLADPKHKQHKLIIFTEHRDTLDFLVRSLEGLGFTGQVAHIHGGLDYKQRDEMVELFRKPAPDGGGRFLVATDAAGEGINLQFCWLMVNYDIPWNPARLEQRMGRIHRYGQDHDPVVITNLVAGKTREGRVMKTLLDKLERIRREMGSDKVFDVIGRLFEDVSFKAYMEQSVTEQGANDAESKIAGTLTKEQVLALKEREKKLLGDGGDVRRELPRLQTNIEQEVYRRMLPGYVRRFVEKAAPLMDIGLEGNLGASFSIRTLKAGALDSLLPWLEFYSAAQRESLTFYRPKASEAAIWLHPGEPVFERFRASFFSRYSSEALRGGVFVDPMSAEPYIFHLALVGIERKPDPSLGALAQGAIVEYRLVGIKQNQAGQIEECSVENLLLLRSRDSNGSASAIPVSATRLAAGAHTARDAASNFAMDNVAMSLAEKWRQSIIETLEEREDFIRRGYDYQDAELAERRSRYSERARAGDPRAQGEITKIKNRQRSLGFRREESLRVLRREPELIAPGEVMFLAHALVVPSIDPADQRHRDDQIEAIAMHVTWVYEEACGGVVRDVSRPELAVAAGLTPNPGFDIESKRQGEEPRAIEVKGRAGIGDIELTENEWIRACNLRERYWLYVVYDCATPHPRLLRVQDPFSKLIVKAKGGVTIDEGEVFLAAEAE